MPGPTPLVHVKGELRSIRDRILVNESTGEVQGTAKTLLILTEATELENVPDDAGGGFAEVYVAPDMTSHIPAGIAKGATVDLVCRAYAVTRNYGTTENPKFGKALGLSFVGGEWGAASTTLHVAESAPSPYATHESAAI